jgi:hypothetical protein
MERVITVAVGRLPANRKDLRKVARDPWHVLFLANHKPTLQSTAFVAADSLLLRDVFRARTPS